MNTFWKLWKSKARPNGEVTFPVRYVTYNLTAGHPIMRVMYFVTRRAWLADFIDFEGSARPRAIRWWQQRSHAPVPATATEAVELVNNGALAETRAITLREDPDDGWPRIVGYKFGPIPDYDVIVSGGWTMYVVMPVSDKGRRWVEANVQVERWQWLGSGFGVEHDYFENLMASMKQAGLEVCGLVKLPPE